jgi:CspA family cold shock protein
MTVPAQLQMIVCQCCGRGFILTSTYLDKRMRQGTEAVIPLLCPTCFSKRGPLPKQCGKVKWFDPRKGYGFIIAEKGIEVFFHRRQILGDDRDEAHEGQMAWFHVRYSEKGPEALNVELGEE